MNSYFKLAEDRQVDKNSILVQRVKDWVDEEYETGRVTVLTDEELTTVIERICAEEGINL